MTEPCRPVKKEGIILGKRLHQLQVVRRETSVFGDAGEHARAYFFFIMKCKRIVRVTTFPQDAMRPSLSFYLPPDF